MRAERYGLAWLSSRYAMALEILASIAVDNHTRIAATGRQHWIVRHCNHRHRKRRMLRWRLVGLRCPPTGAVTSAAAVRYHSCSQDEQHDTQCRIAPLQAEAAVCHRHRTVPEPSSLSLSRICIPDSSCATSRLFWLVP